MTTGKCVNCIVCKDGSEFCPRSEKYDPDAYLKWEEALKKRRTVHDNDSASDTKKPSDSC